MTVKRIKKEKKSTEMLQPKAEPPRIGWNTPIRTPIDHQGQQAIIKQMVSIMDRNWTHFGGWSNAFDQMLDLMLLALQHKEKEYLAMVKKMDKRAVEATAEISALLVKAFCYDYLIYDYLGDFYQQIASLSKQKWFGQYFTPFQLAYMMSKITMGDIKADIARAKKTGQKIKLNEPAIGSGVMFLAAKKAIIEEAGLGGLDYYEFTGQDSDYTCVKMAQIQMIMTDYRYMSRLLMVHLAEAQMKVKDAEKKIAETPAEIKAITHKNTLAEASA